MSLPAYLTTPPCAPPALPNHMTCPSLCPASPSSRQTGTQTCSGTPGPSARPQLPPSAVSSLGRGRRRPTSGAVGLAGRVAGRQLSSSRALPFGRTGVTWHSCSCDTERVGGLGTASMAPPWYCRYLPTVYSVGDLSAASNIILSNGLLDPWSSGDQQRHCLFEDVRLAGVKPPGRWGRCSRGAPQAGGKGSQSTGGTAIPAPGTRAGPPLM